MMRMFVLCCAMLPALGGVASAFPLGNPPLDLYDVDNNGVVHGWDDLFAAYDLLGTGDPDADVDLDGDVDWDDLDELDNFVTLYDTNADFVVNLSDQTWLTNYINNGGTSLEHDINQDGYLTSMDPLWINNSYYKSAWKNPVNNYDVNNDGLVTSNDALQIANFINANGEGPLLGRANKLRAPFYDVNGDKSITEADFDLVVDYLN